MIPRGLRLLALARVNADARVQPRDLGLRARGHARGAERGVGRRAHLRKRRVERRARRVGRAARLARARRRARLAVARALVPTAHGDKHDAQPQKHHGIAQGALETFGSGASTSLEQLR